MTGLQNTGVSIEQYLNLQKQISEMSGKFDEQAKLIVTTVKNEQYKDIISSSNDVFSNRLTRFGVFITIIGILIGFRVQHSADKAIDAHNKTKKLKKIASDLNKETKDFFENKSSLISDKVMQIITDNNFKRLEYHSGERAHIKSLIMSTENKYIKTEQQYMLLVEHSMVIAYQFFPLKIFLDGKIDRYFSETETGNYSYCIELLNGTKEIYNWYKANKGNSDGFKNYIDKLSTHIQKYPYTSGIDKDLDKLKILIEEIKQHENEIFNGHTAH